jgi:hypothetical protein
MNEHKLEAEIQAKGLNAPRLTPAGIDGVICGAQFWQPEGTTLTVCAMKLTNGTMVVGESACVSEANFDAEIGKNVAYDNAREKIWQLEGYLLREKLSKNGDLPSGLASYAIGDKVTSITGAMKVGVTGVVEVIHSEKSVGARLDNGDLWHEHSAHWAKA